MALNPSLRQRSAAPPRPLQIRVRGPSEQFSEWELVGALAGLARERDLDVRVEWLLDDEPRPRSGGREAS